MKFIYKITFLFLIFPLIASANIDKKKHERTKKINKKYKVNTNAKVSINNKYGDIKITTWNKKNVEIEVQITVKGDDLESIENMLEKINIEFKASNNFVTAKTFIEKKQTSWSFWKRSNNVNYKINYTIKMPITNSVDLDNHYGNIFLDNLLGKADIKCDYGQILIGKLSADNNNINIDYCSNSTIGFMKGGYLDAGYSKITIEESETLKSNTDYSTIKFDNTTNLDFNIDYGSINIGKATHVRGNSDFANIAFGIIKKSLKLDTDYGAISVKNIAKNFDLVDINGKYAVIKIGIENNAFFDFVIDLQYASFKGDKDKIEFFKNISKPTKKYYEGKFGRGNSNSRLKIKSQYGGVSIKEN